MKTVYFNIYVATLFFLSFFPVLNHAQDLTETEIEKVQSTREALIRDGLMHQPVITPLQAVDANPLISFSVYSNKSASFNHVNSRDTEFNPSGTRLYIVDRGSQSIKEYHLSAAWDIETVSYVRELNISSEMGSAGQPESAAHGLYIRKNDGVKMYVFNRTEIWEYTLSTPWDVSTGTVSGYKELNLHTRGHSIDFKPDGSFLFVDDRSLEAVVQYELSTPWDIETADFDYSFDISGQQEEVRGLQLNQNGTRMYLIDTIKQEILEYHISTPYDIRTASFIGSFSVRSQTSDPRGITFRPDFKRYYVTGAEENRVYQYNIFIPDPNESSLAVSLDKVIADGSFTSRISVTVRDEDGNRLPGVRVDLDSNSGTTTIHNVNRTTNSNGVARFDVSNSEVETVTFTAKASNVSINENVTVRFVGVDANESSISANREKVIANGIAAARVTVTARDEDGDELEGVRITLNSGSNSAVIRNNNSITNSAGEATFDVRNSKIEPVILTARGMGTTINQTVTIRFVGVDADESSITANREKVLANGTATGTVTVTARDEDGDVLQDVEITLVPVQGNSSVNNIQDITDSEGRARFNVSNNFSELVEFRASGMGVTLTESIFINFVTVNSELSTVSVSPESIQADGQEKSTITVTARDDDGDLLPGARVELSENGNLSTIETIQNVTDSNAEAFFRVSGTTPSVVQFTVIAEGVNLEQKAEVTMLPVAPVVLSASNVKNRQFTANWELVDGTESYIIDVSADSSFAQLIPNYQNRDVGLQTSYIIEGVNPGTQYMYRVRAQAAGLTSNHSGIISTTTYPDIPVASAATHRSALYFTANWQNTEGAQQYRLDVAHDPDFNSIVQGYENVNVGPSLNYTIDGLNPGTSYYYRVRAEAGPRVSDHSNTVATSTLMISSERSEIASEQLRVLANGNQTNNIKIIVRSDEGVLIEGVPVELKQESGHSDIEQIQPVTDENGIARFAVSSVISGKAVYNVSAAEISIGDLSVEFLEDEGILKLGDNYPNPFRIQTTIPLTIPRSMHVNLTVYNSLGSPVRTLIDETIENGYYEIPFDSNELASGVYFYRVIADSEILTEKMVLVK